MQAVDLLVDRLESRPRQIGFSALVNSVLFKMSGRKIKPMGKYDENVVEKSETTPIARK